MGKGETDPEGDEAAGQVGQGGAAAEDERHGAGEVHVLFVDGGGVVVDHIRSWSAFRYSRLFSVSWERDDCMGNRTCELLHDVDRQTQADASEVAHRPALEQLLVLEWPAARLLLDRYLDRLHHVDNLWVVDGRIIQSRNDVGSFGGAIFLDEEAWRLGQGDHLQDETDGEEGLESDGPAPLDGPVDIAEAEVHPVRDAQADDGDGALGAEEHAAVLWFGEFGLVGGDVGTVEAVALVVVGVS